MYKLTPLLSLLMACSTKQNLSCETFKTGKFLYHSSYSGRDYIINRTDSSQTETLINTDDSSIYKVKWTAPCEYHIIAEDTSDGAIKVKVLKNEIVSVTSDYYVVRESIDSMPDFRIDTLRILTEETH